MDRRSWLPKGDGGGGAKGDPEKHLEPKASGYSKVITINIITIIQP